MGMNWRWTFAALLALALVPGLAAAPAAAQQQEAPGRPGILAATGLLQTETLELPATEDAPGLALEISTSQRVEAGVITQTDDPSVIAVIQFTTGEGSVVESLVLTTASVTTGDPEDRRFALANLLVLRSYPALAQRSEGAQLIGFGPLPGGAPGAPGDPLAPVRPDAVHSIGTFTGPAGEPLFFRHVGMVVPGRERAVIALATINTDLMPVRNEADLADTYSGRALDSLRFLPAADPDAPAD